MNGLTACSSLTERQHWTTGTENGRFQQKASRRTMMSFGSSTEIPPAEICRKRALYIRNVQNNFLHAAWIHAIIWFVIHNPVSNNPPTVYTCQLITSPICINSVDYKKKYLCADWSLSLSLTKVLSINHTRHNKWSATCLQSIHPAGTCYICTKFLAFIIICGQF